MLQFNCEEELWQDSRSHAVWLLNRVPNSKYVPDQEWLTPRQQQFPDRKDTDLTTSYNLLGSHVGRTLKKPDVQVKVMLTPEGNKAG